MASLQKAPAPPRGRRTSRSSGLRPCRLRYGRVRAPRGGSPYTAKRGGRQEARAAHRKRARRRCCGVPGRAVPESLERPSCGAGPGPAVRGSAADYKITNNCPIKTTGRKQSHLAMMRYSYLCKLPGRIMRIRLLYFTSVMIIILLLVAGALTALLPSIKDDKAPNC